MKLRVMATRFFVRWAAQILIVFIFTTLVLMVLLSRSSDDTPLRQSVARRKVELLDEMRAEQLRKLQATIFLNPDRPPDRNYNINVTQSERIPLEREVLDSRPTACHTIRYDPSHDLTTTVIIPFYNEALSMLLRTVHSILRHTPDSLLEEIIIIDDHSPNHDLKAPLERYVKFLPKVNKLHTFFLSVKYALPLSSCPAHVPLS